MTKLPENPPASGAAAPVLVGVADVADAASAVTVAVSVAVGVLDAVEVATPLGTSSGLKVPQTGQSSEPGFSRRHSSKVATQIEFGTDPT